MMLLATVENAPAQYTGRDRSSLEAVLRHFFGEGLQARDELWMLDSGQDLLICPTSDGITDLSGRLDRLPFTALLDAALAWLGDTAVFLMLPQERNGRTFVCVWRS